MFAPSIASCGEIKLFFTVRRFCDAQRELALTLYDKLWDSHVVRTEGDGTALLYIDRHLVHEVTSPQAFEGLRLAGRKPWRVTSIVATADHNTPTQHWERGIDDPTSRVQVDALDANMPSYGAKAYFPFRDKRQGIVHVIGPENGATLPGMTVVCGDSHTSTHGAFGCLAFGIGTSEVEHVLATQCLLTKQSKSMRVSVDGTLRFGCTAKDIALAVIGKIGTAGGSGYAIEFDGAAVRALSMEGRMTVCNMAIEARRARRHGRRRRDDDRVSQGRPFAPARKARCGTARSHTGGRCSPTPGAKFDRDVNARCGDDRAAGDLGHVAGDGHHDRRPRARSGQGNGSRSSRGHRARADLHGPDAEHCDHRHPHRQGVHRLVHQFAHRGSARRGGRGRRAGTRPTTSSWRWSCPARAW